jgi:hypothetical protein
MNGQITIERKDNQKSALRKILDTMKPYLAEDHGRKKERSLMKYAILLSEAELDCIVKLCQRAVVSERRNSPKAKPLTTGRLF